MPYTGVHLRNEASTQLHQAFATLNGPVENSQHPKLDLSVVMLVLLQEDHAFDIPSVGFPSHVTIWSRFSTVVIRTAWPGKMPWDHKTCKQKSRPGSTDLYKLKLSQKSRVAVETHRQRQPPPLERGSATNVGSTTQPLVLEEDKDG